MSQCENLFTGPDFTSCSNIVDQNALIENCMTDICNVQNDADEVAKVVSENRPGLIDSSSYF